MKFELLRHNFAPISIFLVYTTSVVRRSIFDKQLLNFEVNYLKVFKHQAFLPLWGKLSFKSSNIRHFFPCEVNYLKSLQTSGTSSLEDQLYTLEETNMLGNSVFSSLNEGLGSSGKLQISTPLSATSKKKNHLLLKADLTNKWEESLFLRTLIQIPYMPEKKISSMLLMEKIYITRMKRAKGTSLRLPVDTHEKVKRKKTRKTIRIMKSRHH